MPPSLKYLDYTHRVCESESESESDYSHWLFDFSLKHVLWTQAIVKYSIYNYQIVA